MQGREMPRYQCHKKVWAFKIKDISDADTKGDRSITPADEGFLDFVVSAEYFNKHNPKIGGYYVVYPDGYKSFSPADAFESGYTRIN